MQTAFGTSRRVTDQCSPVIRVPEALGDNGNIALGASCALGAKGNAADMDQFPIPVVDRKMDHVIVFEWMPLMLHQVQQ